MKKLKILNQQLLIYWKKINPKIDKLQIKNGHFYHDIEVKYTAKSCKNGFFSNSIFRDKDNPRKRRNDI